MTIYKRIGCTIEIEEEAEKWLSYNNIRQDSFANHLYLFSDNFPMDGNGKIMVHLSKTYSGEGQLFIRFERFKLPEQLIPEPPSGLLKELKEKEPELYQQVVGKNLVENTTNSSKETGQAATDTHAKIGELRFDSATRQPINKLQKSKGES